MKTSEDGTVVLKRWSSSNSLCEAYEIEVRDASSRVVIRVTLTAEQLAGALTALVSPCRFLRP